MLIYLTTFIWSVTQITTYILVNTHKNTIPEEEEEEEKHDPEDYDHNLEEVDRVLPPDIDEYQQFLAQYAYDPEEKKSQDDDDDSRKIRNIFLGDRIKLIQSSPIYNFKKNTKNIIFDFFYWAYPPTKNEYPIIEHYKKIIKKQLLFNDKYSPNEFLQKFWKIDDINISPTFKKWFTDAFYNLLVQYIIQKNINTQLLVQFRTKHTDQYEHYSIQKKIEVIAEYTSRFCLHYFSDLIKAKTKLYYMYAEKLPKNINSDIGFNILKINVDLKTIIEHQINRDDYLYTIFRHHLKYIIETNNVNHCSQIIKTGDTLLNMLKNNNKRTNYGEQFNWKKGELESFLTNSTLESSVVEITLWHITAYLYLKYHQDNLISSSLKSNIFLRYFVSEYESS